MFGDWSAAWSGSAAAALAVAGHGFWTEPKLFWRGPEATLRKKPNAKEDDMKKEYDLISGVPWGSG